MTAIGVVETEVTPVKVGIRVVIGIIIRVIIGVIIGSGITIWFRIELPAGGRFHFSILIFDIRDKILKRLDCLIPVHRYFA
jgi:hypothetical protein